MSAQWNGSYPNLNIHRSFVSRPMILACLICDKVFLTSNSLIEHYESHQHELAQRTQNHQVQNYLSSLRERNVTNSNNFQPRLYQQSNLQLHQRAHPYFPHGYQMLNRQRTDAAARNNPYLVSPQTANSVQPQRHPVMNNGNFQFPNLISERTLAGGNQFVIHQQMPTAQPTPPPQRAPQPKSKEQKRQEESPEKRTIWYLHQMEKPIPTVIDLQEGKETSEYSEVDLALKL